MKLVHPNIEQSIIFKEGIINVLVIENKKLFSDMLWELKRQSTCGEGRFVLSSDTKEIDLKGKLDIIFNPLELDFSQKKIVTQLHKDLFSICDDEDHYLKTKELSANIIEYMEDIIDVSEYPVCIDNEYDIISIFKTLNARIDNSQESILELITDYIKIVNRLLEIDIFILLNVNTFLDFAEIELLYQCAIYGKINLLLMESSQPQKHAVEKMIIIDNDLCEIGPV